MRVYVRVCIRACIRVCIGALLSKFQDIHNPKSMPTSIPCKKNPFPTKPPCSPYTHLWVTIHSDDRRRGMTNDNYVPADISIPHAAMPSFLLSSSLSVSPTTTVLTGLPAAGGSQADRSRSGMHSAVMSAALYSIYHACFQEPHCPAAKRHIGEWTQYFTKRVRCSSGVSPFDGFSFHRRRQQKFLPSSNEPITVNESSVINIFSSQARRLHFPLKDGNAHWMTDSCSSWSLHAAVLGLRAYVDSWPLNPSHYLHLSVSGGPASGGDLWQLKGEWDMPSTLNPTLHCSAIAIIITRADLCPPDLFRRGDVGLSKGHSGRLEIQRETLLSCFQVSWCALWLERKYVE